MDGREYLTSFNKTTSKRTQRLQESSTSILGKSKVIVIRFETRYATSDQLLGRGTEYVGFREG